MATSVLSVSDVSCGHRQATITNAPTPLDGVQAVDVDIPTKKVTVEYDPQVVDLDHLRAVLAGEDYPVASVE